MMAEQSSAGNVAKVAIAIPAFQAGPWVAAVIRDTQEVRDSLGLGDLLVVDDGSTDHTADEARAAGAEVLTISHNQGKGNALKTAFDELFGRGFDAVITLDADGQHIATEIPALLACRERTGAHLVLGTRDHLFAAMSPLRRFANTLSSRIISMVAGQVMLDIQTGFRLYSRELVTQTGFPEARFEAESAVVVRAMRRRLGIACTPIRLKRVDGRRSSHYRPLVDSWRIARAVARARLERLG